MRRGCGMKLRAVVLLQAQVRMKQQRGRYRKLLAHHRRMKEAEERRQREEEELKKKMKAEEAKKEAERKQQEYLAYLEMQAREEEERERLETERKKEELKKIEERHDRDREEVPDDSQVVEDIFGFLGGEAGGQPGYVVSEHLGGDESHLPLPAVEVGRVVLHGVGWVELLWSNIDVSCSLVAVVCLLFPLLYPSANQIEEDITVYKFSKFAATYFQGAATHSWIHRQLKQPLLPLKLDHDRQAALAIWTVIRRFMGDLPEPKVTQQADKKVRLTLDHNSLVHNGPEINCFALSCPEQAGEGLGKLLYQSIGRAFNRKKLNTNTLEQQMQEAELTGDVPPEGQSQSREDRKKENLRKRIASMTLKKKSKISQV